MKLTILGKYGPFPKAGGACSGYLLEHENIRLVLDMGNGTLSRLLSFGGIGGINAVILSHLHSDHMSDMLILRYALQQLYARGENVSMPLSVVAPAEPELEFRQLASSGVFDMLPAEDGMRLNFADMTITLHRMIHPVTSFAMDIRAGSRRLFYTGDTGYNAKLIELCRGADVLLADSGLLEKEKTTEIAAHLTAREAGSIAKEANVGRLILTHIWSGHDDSVVQREAASVFAGALVAQEGHSYEI